jgi:glucose-1-phosphate adenylyltransferase
VHGWDRGEPVNPTLLRDLVAVLLAGGAGERLYPLTRHRAKPAVAFGGPYRIVDFTLSNCINSGLRKIFIATQYKSLSLARHVRLGWSVINSELGEFIEMLPPQKRVGEHWYLGTADAVYQNLYSLKQENPKWVLILSGDHIYKMDYGPMLRAHEERRADLTVAVMNVLPEETSRFGIVLTDEAGRVTEFLEKPKVAPSTLANMGVYVFSANALIERMQALAAEHPDLDFGKHVIPSMVQSHAIYTFPFEGYWVDVGTVDAYWSTSMELVSGQSKLDLYDPSWVIHTRSEERAPAKVGPQAVVRESILSNGCIVRGQVFKSVLSPGVYVSPGAIVRESVIMNDTWIGPGAVVDRCIVDKNAVVGPGTQLGWGDDYDTPNAEHPDRFFTGPTIVGKGARIPGGKRVGRNVVIETDVDEEAFDAFGDVVPSGATVGEVDK